MVRKARIRLTSTDHEKLKEVCRELKEISEKAGVTSMLKRELCVE